MLKRSATIDIYAPISSRSHAGAVNPYAMIEVKLGRKIDWPRIADCKQFIQTVLNFPYAQLFDPRHGSPLYPGRRFDEREGAFVAEAAHAQPCGEPTRAGNRNVYVLGRSVRDGGLQWIDPGMFFINAPDFAAPVQGYLPNCDFIAAITSLAWSDPHAIAQAVRPVAASDRIGHRGFMERVFFFEAAGAKPHPVEVSELLPLIAPGRLYQYARSSHSEEIWPAIYEKAWVKWLTREAGDRPDYSKITGGDPVRNLVSLTGKKYRSHATRGKTAEEIWSAVRSNCSGSWTFNPMVATTYPSASLAPSPIDYDSASIVAAHCYSILGWQWANNKRYIVLRDPWGYRDPLSAIDSGPWTSFAQFDGGHVVNDIDLSEHGVFAMTADIFRKYFGWFGWVE
jgi:hypothetical protein